MTRYFMRDTPLCQLEQQMMTPPNFKARGHGRYSPGFQYSSEDTECPYCINFRRNQPCPLKLCICLDERIAAGALNLNEFVRDCFFPEAGVQLLARLERNFTCCSISFFLNECHRERWQHWRERYYRMSGRNLAALFLLTAYEDTLAYRAGTGWIPLREWKRCASKHPLILKFMADGLTEGGAFVSLEVEPWEYDLLVRRTLERLIPNHSPHCCILFYPGRFR